MTQASNPFTERGRIVDPQHFIARWRELSLIFDRLETRRPVLIAGARGVGKSSLLTHIAQSAGVTLERPDLESLFIDLSAVADAATFYRLVVEALHSRGDTPAAFELALIENGGPVLLALDRADHAIAAGWGESLLENLARVARRAGAQRPMGSQDIGDLLIVAVVNGPAPLLSEPFAVITLGAMASTEVRLLAETYLANTDVSFTPGELRELTLVSAGHPAYLQRAAYHLYRAKTQPPYDWRAAYFNEAREQPVPGAPLSPAAFEGVEARNVVSSTYGELGDTQAMMPAERPPLASMGGVFAVLLPPLVALLAGLLSGSWLVALVVLLIAIIVAVVFQRRSMQNASDA